MISRVTNQMMLAASQANLQTQARQLATLQNQGSSQLAISKPSDNPTGIATSLALKSQQSANAQYSSNAADATNWLNSVSGALTTSVTALQQVRSLTVQAANGATLSQSAKDTIVTQLQGLKSQLMAASNTTYLGRSVFAVDTDAGTAFNADYSYNGTAGSTVSRKISATQTVSVSGDGAATFGTGTGSVFAMIDSITSAIQSGGDVNAQISSVDTHLAAVSAQQSQVASSYNAVQDGTALLKTQAQDLTTQRSDIDNVDITKTVLELTAQQNAYQAALAVTSKALQPTLMSFLS